jgi:8-oxo-dGTP diphosphatase
MRQIAQILLFDRDGRLLIYLRDDKPGIPFPNCWDFFGGHVEAGETPEQALARELQEELNIEVPAWRLFRRYNCLQGDAYSNEKYIYYAQLDPMPAELELREGQRLAAIAPEERKSLSFANILETILEDFIEAGLWPAPVDNSFARIAGK